jgi:uncharacterized protein YbjT (DUF2867 family)
MDRIPMSRVLVTGATGYVGGRLVPLLLAQDHLVRCLVRSPGKLDQVSWRDRVEVLQGSVAGPLEDVMSGVDVAVYLIHGIGDGPDWVAQEARDAEHFRAAAQVAGVERIVYLGGMGRDDNSLSEHLASRHAVGRALAAGSIPVAELRAAVIIGSGSASFEMLRYLVEVLPVMVTPKWVSTRTQPIAISDVLTYLMRAIEASTPLQGVFEIGGPDVVSYAEMMAIYADEAGLKRRRLIPVPVLTPRLSSHWVGLVTPVPASLARPLVDSLVNEVVVRDERTIETLGAPQRSLREAIRLALGRTRSGEVPTAFTTADLQPFRPYETDPKWAGGTELIDERAVATSATPEALFAAISALGGSKGWHSGEWLWRVRGYLDLIWGGPGLRRGRRHPSDLVVGDFVDFWRVDQLDAPRFLRLHAEMVLPGDAWLEWTVETTPEGSRLIQRARFKPRGLWGRVYWYSVIPFHGFVFPGLLKGVIRDAEDQSQKPDATSESRSIN